MFADEELPFSCSEEDTIGDLKKKFFEQVKTILVKMTNQNFKYLTIILWSLNNLKSTVMKFKHPF